MLHSAKDSFKSIAKHMISSNRPSSSVQEAQIVVRYCIRAYFYGFFCVVVIILHRIAMVRWLLKLLLLWSGSANTMLTICAILTVKSGTRKEEGLILKFSFRISMELWNGRLSINFKRIYLTPLCIYCIVVNWTF